ncbi:MAG: hypothetical protein KDD28_05745 [Phaeodactylibacter sp.]|nr:hypothetical protein [Phaeodactylibacter sp.]
METTVQRKKRKKKYTVNWLKSIRRKRNMKILYKKQKRRPAKPDKN